MCEDQLKQPWESFMEVAQREMIAFEFKEREFSKKLKQDRAEELKFAAPKN